MPADWVGPLIFTLLCAAIYDIVKYGAKHVGKIIPPVKRFHQNIFELRNLAVCDPQIAYDFYARAFAFALFFGLYAVGLVIGASLLYYLPESTRGSDILYYCELIALSICTYIASLWLGAVWFITKARLDYFRQQAVQGKRDSDTKSVGAECSAVQ